MKNRKIIGMIGALVFSAATAVGCGSASEEVKEADEVESEDQSEEESEEETQTENETKSPEKDTEETEIMIETEYDPATEIPTLVYGPPETFEDTETSEE
ncbi:MAG: hypothetical protein K6E13_07210 [Lachnospiraceae bacterium]|nr:hypothetical protein [Lachnospiraceae bacterium]